MKTLKLFSCVAALGAVLLLVPTASQAGVSFSFGYSGGHHHHRHHHHGGGWSFGYSWYAPTYRYYYAPPPPRYYYAPPPPRYYRAPAQPYYYYQNGCYYRY